MTVPVFEEYEPALDCSCAGCAERRRDLAKGLPVRCGGHPAAHGARRALVVVTAAGVALGAAAVAPARAAGAVAAPGAAGTAGLADTGAAGTALAGTAGLAGRVAAEADPGTPGSPQGGKGPLYGRPLPGPGSHRPAGGSGAITRAEIINRAKLWVTEKVPYSMEKYWSDGYRQDCSGYVSMAWHLPGNEWTGSLDQFAVRIERGQLQPGDILLFHNPENPNKGSHVTIFGGWTDYTHTSYVAYEQTKPHTRAQSTPMAYWENSDRYLPYRYKGVVEGADAKGSGAGTSTASGASATYPGASAFGPGASNAYVTQLGRMLVERGGKRFYAQGPGPRWGEADRRATEAFQRAQGWRGAEADGLPGPATWRYLVKGLGKPIPAAPKPGGTPGEPPTAPPPGSSAGPAAGAFPGAAYFRPGASNAYVDRLGRRLVQRGFGRHYTQGPGPRWTEADRRNVEAFQRAQGWRGAAADGYPGPETWRRLFA
ncbi:peptidoglycan-binding protein [Streptomyces sp. NPDC093085]|uniref:peptidoglycan-binding protein n=1 Tax=Streptomyces sp. NPDC093085 TaxID=3155068 RepID=UPI0034256A8B